MSVLSYKKIEDEDWVTVPITVDDIKRILDECKVIDICAKEPFPTGKVTIVGVSNESYDSFTLYDMSYSSHAPFTYGGYFKEDHSGWQPWWTFNHTYSIKYDKTKAYIVNNKNDGEILAKFLNFTYGFKNLEKSIFERKNEIERLENELEYLEEAKKKLKKYC